MLFKVLQRLVPVVYTSAQAVLPKLVHVSYNLRYRQVKVHAHAL